MTEKIARALGLQLIEAPECCSPYTEKDYWINGTIVCAEDGLSTYLASPAGREAVEKRVEELWCNEELDRFVRVDSKSDGRFEVCLMHETASPYPEDNVRYCRDTKREAYRAALLWLAEQAEKGGE